MAAMRPGFAGGCLRTAGQFRGWLGAISRASGNGLLFAISSGSWRLEGRAARAGERRRARTRSWCGRDPRAEEKRIAKTLIIGGGGYDGTGRLTGRTGLTADSVACNLCARMMQNAARQQVGDEMNDDGCGIVRDRTDAEIERLEKTMPPQR